MDVETRQFVRRACGIVGEAALDLGGVIAAPGDAGSAAALLHKMAEVRSGALSCNLTELAGLAAEAQTPLEAAVAAGRPIDRRSLQTVGWAVQALSGALAAADAGAPPARV